MANRPEGYGLTAELAGKTAAKFDADLANEAFTWMANVLQTGSSEAQGLASQLGTVSVMKDFHTPLKNGVILCHLLNTIKPGSVKKINTNNMAFKQMENIGNFLAGCVNIGINKIDLFQTVDLYEASNIAQVVDAIIALGRKSQKTGYDGPRLNPKEESYNKREFTDELLRSDEGVIGLQAGSTPVEKNQSKNSLKIV